MPTRAHTSCVERSADGGTTWQLVRHGYVTDIELPGAQEWFITVGGARRRERNTPVARILQGLSDWDVFRPTAIMGGPVVGGLPGVLPDLGRPRFAVVATQANTSAGAGDGHVALEFRYGPLAPRFEPLVTGQLQRPPDSIGPGTATWADGFDLANARARPFYVDSPPRIANGSAPNGPVFFRGYFPRLGVWLYDTAGTLVAGPLTPFGLFQLNPPTYAGGGVSDLGKLFERASGNGNGTFWLDWAMDDPDVLAAVGTILEVVIAPLEPTADYPLWYIGHPTTVAKEALEAIGCTVDAEFENVTGTEDQVVGCLTDPKEKVGSFVSRLGTLFGFSVTLTTDATTRAVVNTQNRLTVAGLTSIDDDDLRAIGGPTFTIRESSRRNVFRVRLTQFVPWDPALGMAGIERPITELIPFETPFEFTYSPDGSTRDADTYGEQTIEVSLTASVAMGNASPATNASPLTVVNQFDYLEALAHRLFDRHGRGTPEYGLALTGAVSLSEGLGDAIALSTSHFPNALPTQTPSSQRGGVRPVRIIARTREPAGDMLTAIDEGSGVAYAGAFDISVAEDTIDPTTFLQVTITGVTQLTSDGALVDLFVGLMAAGSTVSPDHAGTLLKTVDTRALATATHTVRLGPLPPNVIWWVRAEAWVYGGAPSSSTYWYSVTGPDTSGNPTAGPGGTPGSTPPPNTPPTPVGSVSSLGFTNVGTDYFTATWTSTDASYPVAIRLKATGAASWEFSTLLGVGSTQYQFLGLVPNTDYTVEVNLAALATGGPLGSTLSGTQTTNAGAATLTLNTPGGLAVFANYDPTHANAHAPGAVGFRVLVTPVVPHFVRMEMTAETAVGSGVPGPWPSIGDPLAFAQDLPATNDFLYMVRYVSNDGRKRYFRAQAWKQVGGTRIASAWTSTLEVMPYTNVQVSGSGATLQQEFTAAAVTGTGATGINGSTGSVTIAAGNTITAWRFAANEPLRLRLYRDAASQTADLTRAINATVSPAVGLWYEVILPDGGGNLVLYPSPTPTLGPASSGALTVYYTLASTRDSTNVSDLLVQMIYTTT